MLAYIFIFINIYEDEYSMINVGIVGVENVASMLIQGVEYYRRKHGCNGLIHCTIDSYKVSDIRFVYAIDVSKIR